MFYIKCKNNRVEIREDNVYTTCPGCRREFKVNLADMVTEGELDLYGTQVYCHECSVELNKEEPR